MRSLIYIGCLIVCLILLKIFFLDKKQSSQTDAVKPSASDKYKTLQTGPSMQVQVYVAEMSITENDIFATGTVVANEDVELRAETSGRLTGLNMKEGGFVKRGQLIAKLKDDDIKVRIKRNKLEQELAAQIESRQQKLLDINAISKEEFEIAVNKVKTLQSDLDALHIALSQTEVRAPFDGFIGLKNISVGAYVSPTTVIARLVQTIPAKIDFAIPEKYASKLRNGSKIEFTYNDETNPQIASIIAVEPLVDESLRTIKVRASTPNKSGILKPGNYLKIKSSLGANKSILIPSEAIIPFIGGKKIYVMSGGKAEERTITTGVRSDKSVEVLEGIAVGDSVITSAIMSIKKGQSVKAISKTK